MVEAIKSVNLGLRFILEMAALGAVGFWGFRLDQGTALKWLAGVGLPLAVIVVWSLFIAPLTDSGLSATAKMWLGCLILSACAVALAAMKYPVLAGVFGAAIVANTVLMQVWHQ